MEQKLFIYNTLDRRKEEFVPVYYKHLTCPTSDVVKI